MAGEGDDEEANIEQQLEQQLKEQKESLSAVDDALASDPSNPELLSVHEELLLAIRDAKEGLLHLKRSRLLKEADAILLKQEPDSIFEDAKVETLDPSQVEPEPLEAEDNSENYSVGSKCRFRHTDGRWYNGHILGFEGTDSARISFLTPTSESMQMCKFFLQQRCRFGGNCRLSHGFNVPMSSLKQYVPTIWQQSLVGSSILATSGGHSGIWRKAELEAWDENLCLAQVVFQDDGTSAKLSSDSLTISEYAQMSDESDGESDSLSSDASESNDDDYTTSQGIGFSEAAAPQSGVQTETAIFAKWEHHTRGIASKMMASMGYREGTGLGVSGQGILDPVSVKVLPKKQSLDHALTSGNTNENKETRVKKRSRGGKRKREKKFAEAARAAKEEEVQNSDVFSFINNQLAGQDPVSNGSGKKSKGSSEERKEDRRSLVAYDDEVKDLRSRVVKLEEMVNRNRRDKAMFEAATRKLNETQKALADAEAAHASASKAVVSKEREKKWLKF
ncbi:uncharacterized protein A4U43_C05F25690 [Asparagus officinalis]|uniref:Zinc finger CCCH domain-containing protein 18 n=1 Tax=Asparagus officinalis TaxID=4686 RepID=A0A5P1EWZ9_ASPOF|nr:zinc finger CCCH domain-containing protein 18 [Asparagus officinalis]ONK69687.1 uncharacterized protein A4U43_C05F25690 [Asparagus officinalis]